MPSQRFVRSRLRQSLWRLGIGLSGEKKTTTHAVCEEETGSSACDEGRDGSCLDETDYSTEDDEGGDGVACDDVEFVRAGHELY